jgi:hypothetical protein
MTNIEGNLGCMLHCELPSSTYLGKGAERRTCVLFFLQLSSETAEQGSLLRAITMTECLELARTK